MGGAEMQDGRSLGERGLNCLQKHLILLTRQSWIKANVRQFKPLEEQQKTLLEEGGAVSLSRWQAKEQTDVTTSFD